MQLHDQLSVLTLQNPTVLDDPNALRAALAPYVAGDPTATDEAELLVALVGQGVTRQLVGAIDAGTDAAGAVGDLGGRYASGLSAPVSTVRWAVAALGYAAGRVSDAEVRRHLLDAAPTQAPSSSPTPSPAAAPGPPVASPPTAYGAPAYPQPTPYAQPAPAYGAPPAPTFPSPGPTRKTRTGLIIASVVAAVVVIAGGVTLVLMSGGDDDETVFVDATGSPSVITSEPTSTEPTSGTPTTADEPTTAVTAVEPVVSQAASDAFVDALNAFSPQFTKASDLMTEGRINHEFDKTLAGASMMRDAVYDLDAATRKIDLSAIQESVNEMLVQDAEMIRLLDRIQNTTNSRKAVRHVAELPITDFTDAFQAVAVEIDSHVG